MSADNNNVIRNSGTRQDTFVVRAKVGNGKWGIWDKRSGGELDSEDVKYYPGGMFEAISLGGRRTTGNVTLSRLYDKIDDQGTINDLFAAVGKKQIQITQRAMDLDGNEWGNPIMYLGILKRVTIPDVDSESTSAALIEIEATITGVPHKDVK
jgi:hypothetical protein